MATLMLRKGGGVGWGGELNQVIFRFLVSFFSLFFSSRYIKLQICVVSILFRASVYGGHAFLST